MQRHHLSIHGDRTPSICVRVYWCVLFAELQRIVKEPDCAVFSISLFGTCPEIHFKYFFSGDAEKCGLHMSSADIVLVIYEETYWV